MMCWWILTYRHNFTMMSQIRSKSCVINQYVKDTVLIFSSLVGVLFGILVDLVHSCTSFSSIYLFNYLFLSILNTQSRDFLFQSEAKIISHDHGGVILLFVRMPVRKLIQYFFIKCVFSWQKIILESCKISKVRVKANLFKSNEEKISEVIKRRLKCP